MFEIKCPNCGGQEADILDTYTLDLANETFEQHRCMLCGCDYMVKFVAAEIKEGNAFERDYEW